MSELECINREDITKYIATGSPSNYLLVTAPFGYGKSWLLNKVGDELKNSNYVNINIKLADTIDIELLKQTLLKKLQKIKEEKKKAYIIFDDLNFNNKQKIEQIINDGILPLEDESLKIVFSSRNMNMHLRFNNLKTQEIKIEVFCFETLKKVIKEYLKNNELLSSSLILTQLFHHIAYYTGGYPKCVDDVLKKIDYQNINGYFKNYNNFEIIKETSLQVMDDIKNQDLATIIYLLSPIRRLNRKLLINLLTHNLIKYEHIVFELEDALTGSKLMVRNKTFIENNITRKLLFIYFRENEKERCLDVIRMSKNQYLTLIDNDDKEIVTLALEWIFLSIEEKLIINKSGTIKEVEMLFMEIISHFSPLSQNIHRENLFQRLYRDVELESMINYYISRNRENFSDVYNHIIKGIKE